MAIWAIMYGESQLKGSKINKLIGSCDPRQKRGSRIL